MPVNPSPKTIGDLISNALVAAADQAAAIDAAKKADQAAADATSVLQTSDIALSGVLAVVGPTYVATVDTNGAVTEVDIYIANPKSTTGFDVLTPSAANTPIPTTPLLPPAPGN